MKNVFVVYKDGYASFTCMSLRSAKEYADKHGLRKIVEYSIIGYFRGTELVGKRVWIKYDWCNVRWCVVDYSYIENVR